MSEQLMQVQNLKKYFSTVKAVDGVDISMKAGESLGLVGESGSGKTTLGRLIIKLYSADSGNILFDGIDITKLSSKKMRPFRKKIQMVFQDPYSSLDPRFTVRGILNEADKIANLDSAPGSKEIRMVKAILDVGLSEECLGRFPHEFSGGERQRIAIARALIMNPKLLILDEAVSSLDVLIQEQIINLLKDLQKKYNLAYLFITHNLRVVKKLCTRIAVMYKGRIVEVADNEELFSNPIHPYTKELLSAAIEYKSSQRDQKIIIDDNSHLIDKGNGHFVIN